MVKLSRSTQSVNQQSEDWGVQFHDIYELLSPTVALGFWGEVEATWKQMQDFVLASQVLLPLSYIPATFPPSIASLSDDSIGKYWRK